MTEKSKVLTKDFWKYDPEKDGDRRGKIGSHEFISVLQANSMFSVLYCLNYIQVFQIFPSYLLSISIGLPIRIEHSFHKIL